MGAAGTTKTTPTVTTWPTASALTYGQTLASSTLTGGSASVSGSFSWTSSTTAPGAGTPSEGVTFTPADTADYNTVAGYCRSGGKQGDSDGDGVADGERNYIRPDAGCVDAERWHGVGRRDFSWTTADNGASNGDKQPGRDLYRDGRG